jgi:hypothetical protein
LFLNLFGCGSSALCNGTRSFAIATYQLPQQGSVASCAWANFDTDDDLDVAHAGRLDALTSVYSRSSTGAYDTSPVDDGALTDVSQGTVAWGDYDNDSDLDLLLTGQTFTGVRISKVYRNDPPPQGSTSRRFVDIAAPLTGVHSGSAAWGDYDNDGDLDILLTGNSASGKITKIYKNLKNVPNNLPSAPVPLTPVYSSTNNTFTLSWNNPNNPDETPAVTLTYNVMIGTQSGGNGGYDLVSPMSKIATGKRFIPAPGNAGTKNTYILNMNGLANGTYYWKVQAIDNVYGASAFALGPSFTFTSPSAKVAEGDSVTDITEAPQDIPKAFALSQNYPNPFNPTTRLNLELPENGRVKAILYDLTGQEVARLQDAEMTAGYKSLDWDGKNNFGNPAGSGTYLVKVVYEGVSGLRQEATSRVTLLK